MQYTKQQQPVCIPLSLDIHNILVELRMTNKPAYIVGGAVRDSILGILPKDIDIEVYNCSIDELVAVLSGAADTRIDLVGKSFGVVKFTDSLGSTYDFSLPRRDSKVSDKTDEPGRGFEVTVDSTMTPKEAAARRDFTINAMAYDPLEEILYDFYGGLKDLKNRILRATTEAFCEDPLRVLRGMQFAARFNMTVDPATAKLAKSLLNAPLVIERVAEEWNKFFIKGIHPSKGIQYLLDTGWIEKYPPLHAIVGVPQDAKHHPEGTVEIHTMLALDKAAEYLTDNNADINDRVSVLAAVLMHDFGKVSTTEIKDNGDITTYGHHAAGIEPAKEFIALIGLKQKWADCALPLVEHHMDLVFYNETSRSMNIRQIAHKLHPANIRLLSYVIRADANGRKDKPFDSKRLDAFMQKAIEENVYEHKAEPILRGSQILELCPNIKTDKTFGDLLRTVHDLYLENKIDTEEEALAVALKPLYDQYALITGDDLINLGFTPGPQFKEILQNMWDLQCNNAFTSKEHALQYLHTMQRC